MSSLRLVIRLALVVPWTLGMFVLRLCVLPLGLVSAKQEQRAREWVFRSWARGVSRIAHMRVEIRGTPPNPPFYQVSNHLTFLDVIALAGVTGCMFVAKSEVAGWPLIGLITRCLNTVFVDRERIRDTVRVNALISDALDRGYGLHMFPGAGVAQDCGVDPFKPALLEPAVRKKYPVHYVAISYRTPPGAPRAVDSLAWLAGVSFSAHTMRVLRLPRFTCTLTFGETPLTADNRKELARKLHEAVCANFEPLN